MTQLDPDCELAKELHQYILTRMDERNMLLPRAIHVSSLLVMMIAKGLQHLVGDEDKERIVQHIIDNLDIIRKSAKDDLNKMIGN